MPPSPSTIQFKNGHQAQAVTQEPGDSAAALVGALRLETRRSVILVAGGAEALPAGTRAFLTQLFGRGVARAAGEIGAVIIDAFCSAMAGATSMPSSTRGMAAIRRASESGLTGTPRASSDPSTAP